MKSALLENDYREIIMRHDHSGSHFKVVGDHAESEESRIDLKIMEKL